jgi:predicted deacylase
VASDFHIAGQWVSPGHQRVIHLSVARLYDFTEMNVPVYVHHGEKPGPVLFICAAIHGDEINGVEIIRRLLKLKSLRHINGTLIAIPIVNVFGFNSRSRYLPDRRDLNRCFPGSENGSLGSRLAHIFTQEIVSKATHGIDLHTAAIYRNNLPQVRACLENKEAKKLAQVFGAPVILNSALRDGSLRQAAQDRNIPLVLYEAGEALRFDENAIKIGLRGVQNVMRAIGMIESVKSDEKKAAKKKYKGSIATNSYWTRAPQSGTLIKLKNLGSRVQKGERLGYITDPFGSHKIDIEAQYDGVIIGASTLPLLNRGDAVFHQAVFEDVDRAWEAVEMFNEDLVDALRTPY